jgi:hypothetical protein
MIHRALGLLVLLFCFYVYSSVITQGKEVVSSVSSVFSGEKNVLEASKDILDNTLPEVGQLVDKFGSLFKKDDADANPFMAELTKSKVTISPSEKLRMRIFERCSSLGSSIYQFLEYFQALLRENKKQVDALVSFQEKTSLNAVKDFYKNSSFTEKDIATIFDRLIFLIALEDYKVKDILRRNIESFSQYNKAIGIQKNIINNAIKALM